MRRLAKGFLLSAMLHAALFGGALAFIAWRDAQAHSIDIDLSGSSLLMRPNNPGGKSRLPRPPQPWILASGKRHAPPPKAELLTQTAQVEEEESVPCPAPCPENAGDWMPAAATSRRPNWVEGLITEDDYPRDLRRQGKQGKVVVDVLIDATGAVRGVSLVQASDPQFNDLVLERLKQSRFRPAYNNEGNAVACRLRMPIVFELR